MNEEKECQASASHKEETEHIATVAQVLHQSKLYGCGKQKDPVEENPN